MLSEESGNDWTRYFAIDKIFSSYSVREEWCINKHDLCTDERIIKALLAMHSPHSHGPLVKRTDEERLELLSRPCPLCNQVISPPDEEVNIDKEADDA